MKLAPITKRSPADQIHARLVSDILSGAYPPGCTLPSEAELAEALGASRSAVRVAVRMLESVHMVRISPGQGAEVLDYRHTCGIDLLEQISHHTENFSELALCWQSVLEMRAALCADIARLCAMRASPEVRREIRQLREHMLIATDENALFAMSASMWDLLITGSGNLAYRLSSNSMLRSLQSNPEMAMQWCLTEMRLTNFHEALVKAIDAGDAEAAEADVRTMMRKGVAVYERHVAMAVSASQADSSAPRAA